MLTLLDRGFSFGFGKAADFSRQLALFQVRHHLDQIHLIRSPTHSGHQGVAVEHLGFALALPIWAFGSCQKGVAHSRQALQDGKRLANPQGVNGFETISESREVLLQLGEGAAQLIGREVGRVNREQCVDQICTTSAT